MSPRADETPHDRLYEPTRTVSATTRPTTARRWTPTLFVEADDEVPKLRSRSKHGAHGRGGCYFLAMAMGATGVVFGDIGTSPLYVYSGIFSDTLKETPRPEDMAGVFAMIFWSLTWVVCWKYVLVVMRVNHEGEGGTFALMQSIISGTRERNGRTLGTCSGSGGSSGEEETRTDEDEEDIAEQGRAPFVTFCGMLGCSLLIGDGAITPVISVLSALSGFSDYLTQTWQVVLAVVILLLLFGVQRSGTKVIGCFAGPVMVLWFLVITASGIFQITQHPEEAKVVVRGLSPMSVWDYCVNSRFAGKVAWQSLAGVVLSVTGAEALYADMGHFGAGPITFAWFCLVYPALVIQYFGQTVMLAAEPGTIETAFYSAVPSQLKLPMTILATLATVLASQALITGMFSLLSQAYALQLLPRLLVVHPNPDERGQVYIPEVNWALCFVCILLCVAFQTSDALAGAYGIAVTGTFLVTTTLLFIVLRRVFRWRLLPTILLTLPMFAIDAAIYSANMLKILDSGWVPILITVIACLLMHSHSWGRRREHLVAVRECEETEAAASISTSLCVNSMSQLLALLRSGRVQRIGSCAVFFTSSEWKVPRSLDRLARSMCCLPRTIVLCRLRFEPVPFVTEEDRVHFEVVDPLLGVYRVWLYFGYAEPLTAQRLAIPRRLSELAVSQIAEHPGMAPLVLAHGVGEADGEDAESPAPVAADVSQVTYIFNRVHHAVDSEHTCWTKFRANLYSFMVLNARRPIRAFGLEEQNTMEISIVRTL